MQALGRHLLVELYQCDRKVLTDVRKVEAIMVGAAKQAKAQVIDTVFHTFNPHGISGIIVIAESHLAIHTWPEYAFASVDVYTCGSEINPWLAYAHLVRKFHAKHTTALEMKRGILRPSSGRPLKHKP